MPPPLPLPPAGSADSAAWSDLASRIEGEVLADPLTRMLYATDASPYEKLPLGVVRPRHREDCIAIVLHAARHRIPLIPRAAGTSLAGQCVGEGLVVDVSRHMTRIVDIDVAAGRARVQPGVILEDLNDALGNDALGNDAPWNDALGPSGLQFAPDTSTANRCMIAGMIGNNACGAYSIRHGTTRDHVIEIEAVLADGTLASFGPLDGPALEAKRRLPTLEGRIYREVFEIIDAHRELILQRYPRPEVMRRNTGYALDVLARGRPWVRDGPPFNLARLLCGSEGTLALVTEATLRLVPRASGRLLLCAHFETLMGAMRGTLVAVRHGPAAVELIDRRILEETRHHLEQRDNRFWIEGDPEAVLIVEFQGEGREDLEARASDLIEDYRDEGLGYAFPIVRPPLAARVWDLRKAGLGLLMNRPGPRKAVTVIEDTAVALADLPEYVTRIQALMEKHGTRCVYYGHASVGLLHFRPELDLKDAGDRERFRSIAGEVADVVAEYGGSLSGEHGDGRLRAPFVERVLGSEVHALLRRVKSAFDPEGIFNPQKVLGAPPLDRDLRAAIRRDPVPSYFDWHEDGGLLGAAERCNGSGACRKRAGRGTMCPSYMATLEERHGTRGRANVFRQLLTQADGRVALSDERLRVVLDLCLMCKGCKSECPASVDMARMKSEFLQHYHDRHGLPLRARVLGEFGRIQRFAAYLPGLAGILMNDPRIKRLLGFSAARMLPVPARETLSRWFSLHQPHSRAGEAGSVILFNDPYTEYHEPHIGIAAVEVLERAGFRVTLTHGVESGRVQLSQGLLRKARRLLDAAIARLYPAAARGEPILGLEPSEILTFRDEAPDLVSASLRDQARVVASRARLFEELMAQEAQRLGTLGFDAKPRRLLVHGHCHAKALCGMRPLLETLAILPEARTEAIPSGCCGMAGAFGYESEHHELSMRIGELVLFPAIRRAAPDTLVVANGTSCRHQIRDGVGRRALHPAEVLRMALRD
ncbi:MAG: FAD-binding and (Fe-S)-binding domain-containing protein [Gammaproteobacteria bacterium]